MSEASPSRNRAALISRIWGPSLLLLALAWAYWDVWTWDPVARHHQLTPPAETWFFSAQATSPPLVFAITAWLLWRRRDALEASIADNPGFAARMGGLLSLLLGGGFAVWAHLVSAPHLLVPSLSLVLLGSALWCGGVRGARAMILPAGFTLFASPLPSVLVNKAIFPLQLWTGQVSAMVANALGRSNMVYGDLIATDADLFQVIETCSGLRTIMTLSMAALLYGEGFGKSARRTALLVAAAPFLALVVNVARVVSIVMNPLSRFAEVHTLQGMVTIFGGVLLLGSFDALVSAVRGRGSRAAPVADPSASSPPSAASIRFATPAALLVAVAVASLALPAWKPTKNTQPPLWKLPHSLGPSRNLRVDNDFFGSVGFTERFLRSFDYENGKVNLFVGLDVRRDGRRSLLSPKTLYPESGFSLRERRTLTVEPGNRTVDEAVLDSRQSSILVFHWRIDLESSLAEGLRAWLEIGRSPLHDGSRAGFVRLSTRIARKPSGREEAEARLRGFLESISPALDEFELL